MQKSPIQKSESTSSQKQPLPSQILELCRDLSHHASYVRRLSVGDHPVPLMVKGHLEGHLEQVETLLTDANRSLSVEISHDGTASAPETAQVDEQQFLRSLLQRIKFLTEKNNRIYKRHLNQWDRSAKEWFREFSRMMANDRHRTQYLIH